MRRSGAGSAAAYRMEALFASHMNSDVSFAWVEMSGNRAQPVAKWKDDRREVN
jgi:hypothetical protein